MDEPTTLETFPPTGPPAPPLKILVVDDEEDTLDLTEAILTAAGYDVLLAASGPRALELVREGPDLILLDVMMPGMSGLAVLERLRQSPRFARIPVILLTARQRDAEVIEGYERGADYYITKPCTSQQILFGLRLLLTSA